MTQNQRMARQISGPIRPRRHDVRRWVRKGVPLHPLKGSPKRGQRVNPFRKRGTPLRLEGLTPDDLGFREGRLREKICGNLRENQVAEFKMIRRKMLSLVDRKRLLTIREFIVSNPMTCSDWLSISMLTGFEQIKTHSRLLRSLSFGDDDYESCVLEILLAMNEVNLQMVDVVEEYLTNRFKNPQGEGNFMKMLGQMLVKPTAFEVNYPSAENNFLSVMMPFGREFDDVYNALHHAAADAKFSCYRADKIWNSQTVIQDVFDLICRASVVIADLTGRNPNVSYELGIAHALGKMVLPITQSIDAVPFDVHHHRVLVYLNNQEGLVALTDAVCRKLKDCKN